MQFPGRTACGKRSRLLDDWRRSVSGRNNLWFITIFEILWGGGCCCVHRVACSPVQHADSTLLKALFTVELEHNPNIHSIKYSLAPLPKGSGLDASGTHTSDGVFVKWRDAGSIDFSRVLFQSRSEDYISERLQATGHQFGKFRMLNPVAEHLNQQPKGAADRPLVVEVLSPGSLEGYPGCFEGVRVRTTVQQTEVQQSSALAAQSSVAWQVCVYEYITRGPHALNAPVTTEPHVLAGLIVGQQLMCFPPGDTEGVLDGLDVGIQGIAVVVLRVDVSGALSEAPSDPHGPAVQLSDFAVVLFGCDAGPLRGPAGMFWKHRASLPRELQRLVAVGGQPVGTVIPRELRPGLPRGLTQLAFGSVANPVSTISDLHYRGFTVLLMNGAYGL